MVSAKAAAAAEASLARGEAAAARGDNAAALKAFKETLEHDPDYTTAQEWIETLTKHSAPLDAGATRRRGAADTASRARSPSPGRPSQLLPTTTSLHRQSPPRTRALGLLLLAVLYDTGHLQDAITALQGGTPPAWEAAGHDHYAMLHLEPTATTQDVKKAYRERSKDTHPDHCPADAAPTVCGETAQSAVNRAHEVLSDSALRRAYDATRKTSLAEKIDAMTRLVSAFSSGELSPYSSLAEIGYITGLGRGSLLWLMWLVMATRRLQRLLALTATLVCSYYLYALYN
jgi:hypothetical protein